jgi:glutamyl-tRNA synthetase
MEISHVIRGEEWLPSLPLHIALYEAFGWNAPTFAHLPLILKPVGKGKLSKRDGDKLGFPVFPLEYLDTKSGETSRGYREDGYFPDAFVNMLAFLGWNPGTEQELFNLEELISAFDLEKVGKSGSKFDAEKTKWFQHQYLIRKKDSELAQLFIPILKTKIDSDFDAELDLDYIIRAISLIKERATFVSDFWDLGDFLFISPTEYDPKAFRKNWKPDTTKLMQELIQLLDGIDHFDSEQTETTVKSWISSKEIGFGKVMQPLRLSLVGAMKGPHLFDIMALIGKKETIQRIEKAIEHSNNQA